MWICDQVVGFGPYDDPAIRYRARMGLFSQFAKADGLSMSPDHGMHVEPCRAPAAREIVVDLGRSPDRTLHAPSSSRAPQARTKRADRLTARLVETADNGSRGALAVSPALKISSPIPSLRPVPPGRKHLRERSTRVATGKGVRRRHGRRRADLDAPVSRSRAALTLDRIGLIFDADKIYVRMEAKMGRPSPHEFRRGPTFTQLYDFTARCWVSLLSTRAPQARIGGPQEPASSARRPRVDFQQTTAFLPLV